MSAGWLIGTAIIIGCGLIANAITNHGRKGN